MRRWFLAAMIFVIGSLAADAAGDWKGKVVNGKGGPVAYANVALLSRSDSTVVCGAVTEEDGTFRLVTKESDGILLVAMLGYRPRYLDPAEALLITLEEDDSLLEGAAVQAVMPKTRLTGEGLQTNVRGSVLENVGTAVDVLAKTPGLFKGQNGLEVIGKGAPLIYINGHKVTDSGELDRLQSNEIQSVEVISNPGAQYDATVRSVVRIRTIRRQGEGFSFNLNASDAQSLRWAQGNDPSGAVNVNYRTGGVDLFGGINYGRFSTRQVSEIEKASFGRTPAGGDWLFENKGDLLNEYAAQSLFGNAGINWQPADNHALGAKLEWGRSLSLRTHTLVHDHVHENGTLVDELTTSSEGTLGDETPYSLGTNVYYNGLLAGKLGVDVNLDYYGTDQSESSLSEESGVMTHDARIRSGSYSSGQLWAAKAVLSYPVWKGRLQAGTEETFTRRQDEYRISGVEIPASSARVREDNYAGFASYGFQLPKVGQFNAGIRYEHVHYAYEDALDPEARLKRDYNKWFPSFSYAGAAGPVQLMLSYSAKTRRPNYALLSGAIRYNSRYLWQSGNVRLQPERSHDISFTSIWSFITFALNYTRTDDAIMTWSAPYGGEGVVLVKPRNIDTPYHTLSAFVNLTPTIGPWTLNYTLSCQPQWLSIEMEDPREPSGKRVARFSGKPLCQAQLLNTFTVKGGWQFELGGMASLRGSCRICTAPMPMAASRPPYRKPSFPTDPWSCAWRGRIWADSCNIRSTPISATTPSSSPTGWIRSASNCPSATTSTLPKANTAAPGPERTRSGGCRT